MPRLPAIREAVGFGLDELGLALTAGGFGGLVASAVAPRLVARFGTRRLILGAGAVYAGMLIPVGLSTAAVVVVAAVMALIFADILVDIAMNLQGSWLNARRSTPIMNRLHGMWSLGTVVGGLVSSGAARIGVGVGPHLVAVALISWCAIVAVGRGLLREDERTDSVLPEGHAAGNPAGLHERSGVESEPVRPGAASPAEEGGPTMDAPGAGVGESIAGRADTPRGQAWMGRAVVARLAIAAGGALALTLEITSSDWAAFRLTEDLGAGPGLAGLGFVAFTAGMTAGRLAGDAVLVRLGSGGLFRLAMVLTVVGIATAAGATDTWVVLAGGVVAGCGIATIFPRLYDDAAQAPGPSGAGLAALTAGNGVAALVTPAVVGAVADTSWSVGAAMAVVTLPAALALIMLVEGAAAQRGSAAGTPSEGA